MKIQHDGRTFELTRAPYKIPEYIRLTMPDGRVMVGCDRFVGAMLAKEAAEPVLSKFRARNPMPDVVVHAAGKRLTFRPKRGKK